MYKYSVIILLYNRDNELMRQSMNCLASVLATTNRKETEIIVVDNGSTVRTNYWEEHADTYIRFLKNEGIARGWNAGLKEAKGKYIAVLGDDTIVHGNWLEELQKAMDIPDCGLANLHVQHLPAGQGIVENYKWASAACFMVTPFILEEVGYFNEGYFPCNFEDWSYFLTIYNKGYKIYRNYGISIQHNEGSTVHQPDLASQFDKTRDYFIKEWGRDAIDVFCGKESIYHFLAEYNEHHSE
jgi:GT2 family glycosyltransferase